MARQEALGLERRHAAKPGGRDRLAVNLVGDVAVEYGAVQT